ncbi:MAG TPA: acylphosphatase [Firmicutes bacterium]|nr:acylphosphatase [Bacillota bacterium]
MTGNARAQIRIIGRVQGVGFRFFTVKHASRYTVTGWVRNRPDGSVEVEAEGPRDRVEAFIEELRHGPSFAHIDDVDVEWVDPRGTSSFEVIG